MRTNVVSWNSDLTEEEIRNIAGNYGHLQDALAEVLRRLKYKTDEEENKLEFKWKFDEDDFKEAFRKARYNTAPGFSGLSMAHLCTITKDKNLSTIYAKILELPFRYGFAYDHWLTSVQALLQKENLPYITRLRIIELFELNYNGMLKYLIGKRFAYFEQSQGLQNPEMYGAVKKKNTHDALELVLTSLNYSRIMQKSMMLAPKDATGCFDMLRAEAIRSIQESKGMMPRGINACRISVLQNMEQHVKTAGKISSHSIKYSKENTFGGVGIGAGSGPSR